MKMNIQAYIHSIRSIKVVRLPYKAEAGKKFKYIEKKFENSTQPRAEKPAPGS